MRKVRVLLATALCNVGGTELSTLSIARWLKKAGHGVTVAANEHPLLKEFSSHGVDVRRVSLHRRDPAGAVCAARELRRCMSEARVDIVDAQDAWTAVIAAVASRTACSRRVPVVWHCRGVRPRTYALMARLGNFLVDFVIANCDFERERLVARGLRPDRVRTIYNFPNVEFPCDTCTKDLSLLREWGIHEPTTVVGTVSRLAKHRGIHCFLEAIALMAPTVGASVRFLVIGDGPERRELWRTAVELGVAEMVTFTGARRDMERVYATLDVLVNPTLWGMGTGNVNCEAMAWETPVIASAVGGIPELVEHGRTGLLVQPGDAPALADAIAYLLAHPHVARQMGRAGKRRVSAMMSPQRLVAQIQQAYCVVVN
jgi:glycosyltransferase involved in cell wall biosynthesis